MVCEWRNILILIDIDLCGFRIIVFLQNTYHTG